MIKPLLQDDALFADVRGAPGGPERLHLWWLGQSGFLVGWNGHHLLLDPYLSDSLTHKYALTDKPHVRVTERVIAPEHLAFVQGVTSSHNHTDHLDAETLQPLLRLNPELRLVVPAANQTFAAARLNVPPQRLDPLEVGASLGLGAFRLHAVPAAHETLERDDAGRHVYLGYVIQAGPWTLYHSGDTVRYAGMEAELRPWQVDVALLPINGRAPERRVAGNLTGEEAAQLARDIHARCVIPCHYEMFAFNTASPEAFRQACARLGQPCAVLRAGERWSAYKAIPTL